MKLSPQFLFTLLLGAVLGVFVTGTLTPAAFAASTDERIAGGDRYATSAAVSKAERPKGAETVFIASGEVFADALAAGPAAAAVNAPILLATSDRLPESTANELARLKPTRLVFVGGTPSLGQSVVDQAFKITAGTMKSAERVAGLNRQQTAIELAKKFLPNARSVFLVNGWQYPDAVSAASAGAAAKMPILLTAGNALSPETQSYLGQRKPGQVTVIGGPATVDERIVRHSRTMTGRAVDRVAGIDRYETNAKLAARYFDGKGDGVVLAAGRNFPDALVASVYSQRGIPVLLTEDSCTTGATRQQIWRYAIDRGQVVRIVGERVQHGVWVRGCPSVPVTPRTCSISSQLNNTGAIVSANFTRADTDELLVGRRNTELAPSASTMKVATAVAAYAVLGPDYRIPTHLYPGTTPGTYVITGMGDPTLKSGDSSFYWDGPSIWPLAAAARKHGATQVGYDGSRFPGNSWNSAWGDPSAARWGSIGNIESLMLDGGRYDPNDEYSARTNTPARDAGNRFAQLVGVPLNGNIRADKSRKPVATVYSQPVRTLVYQMLYDSDNVLAETLARLVAIEQGYDGSKDSVVPAMRNAFVNLGIDPWNGFSPADGSGLAASTMVSPAFMDQLLDLIGDNVGSFRELRGMFPANGKPGHLANRMTAVPSGHVQAKVGLIYRVHSLAGFITTADGQTVRFSAYVWADSGVGRSQKDALDRIVVAAHNCGVKMRD